MIAPLTLPVKLLPLHKTKKSKGLQKQLPNIVSYLLVRTFYPSPRKNEYLNCPTHYLTKAAARGRRSNETARRFPVWLIAEAIHHRRSEANDRSTYTASQTTTSA